MLVKRLKEDKPKTKRNAIVCACGRKSQASGQICSFDFLWWENYNLPKSRTKPDKLPLWHCVRLHHCRNSYEDREAHVLTLSSCHLPCKPEIYDCLMAGLCVQAYAACDYMFSPDENPYTPTNSSVLVLCNWTFICQNRRRKINTEKTRESIKKKKRFLTSAGVWVFVKRCEILLSLPLLGQRALYLLTLTYMPETAIGSRRTRDLLIFFILIWWSSMCGTHCVRTAFERQKRLRRWKTWLQLLKTYDSW